MAMLKTILAPTDFSDLSANGVRYACQLARDVGAALIIFNVVALDESNAVNKREIEQHKKRLEEFVAEKVADAGVGLKVRQMVDAGQPFGAIVDRAEKEGVDLIVMSSHGRSGLSRMLIGSVTDKILRGGSCPVLVVPAKTEN
ncbi:MAG TPA: universal stress protein [Candidatus Limnocylindrales bacterium]|nr:universal stress protein [Candidatus Limnocylindrales bacterium]